MKSSLIRLIPLLFLFALGACSDGGVTPQNLARQGNGFVTALNIINQSNEPGPLNVVLFQQNAFQPPGIAPVAWQVAQQLGVGQTFSLQFPLAFQINAADEFGNTTPLIDGQPGQQYSATSGLSGLTLIQSGSSPTPDEIQIINGLMQGTLTANIYRDEKLLDFSSGILPNHLISFNFNTVLFVNVAPPTLQPGSLIPADVVSGSTAIDLLGIFDADLIVSGNSTQGFTFSLTNTFMK